LEKLIGLKALGDIKDAEIHFDFRSPGWVTSWNTKEYSPGQGMAFGLGIYSLFSPPYSWVINADVL